ncbi:sulfurtransferase TusA family protein [Microbulbifer elongatus]|uniref:Sulfurtransferase TusA family protein n=1 Tax=Microbulbifer elongatus TaxID=86173 RepID=A0ABT1NZH5_9GAMM|nr:sulfurtransferase TusA family protein [Microbulbifer elongatus]MCQ3828181.1 sulfurtransferase TusA family protein [Microbulbifer elongatus]
MTTTTQQATQRQDVHWEDALRVDARGLPCPQPLLAMRRALKELAPGALLHLIATDPASQRDIRSFCDLSGVPLARVETDGESFHFWLRQI